jgi:hypothetical protein
LHHSVGMCGIVEVERDDLSWGVPHRGQGGTITYGGFVKKLTTRRGTDDAASVARQLLIKIIAGSTISRLFGFLERTPRRRRQSGRASLVAPAILRQPEARRSGRCGRGTPGGGVPGPRVVCHDPGVWGRKMAHL